MERKVKLVIGLMAILLLILGLCVGYLIGVNDKELKNNAWVNKYYSCEKGIINNSLGDFYIEGFNESDYNLSQQH